MDWHQELIKNNIQEKNASGSLALPSNKAGVFFARFHRIFTLIQSNELRFSKENCLDVITITALTFYLN